MRDDFEELLGWWRLGCIPASDVVRWADRQIEMASESEYLPEWLISVSVMGPQAFWKRGWAEDPHPREIGFSTAFRLMVEASDPDDDASVDRFARWIAKAAMGEDWLLDEVAQGYMIEDLLSYSPSSAREHARELLAQHRPVCRLIAERLPWRRAAEQRAAADEARRS